MIPVLTQSENPESAPELAIPRADYELGKLFRQSSHYIVGMALTLCLGFISFPIFTRVFSVADYGLIDLAQKIILLVTTFAKAGLQNSGMRFFDRKVFACNPEKERGYYSTMFFGVGCLSLLATVPFVLVVRTFNDQIASILLFSSVLVSLRAVESILWVFLRVEERTKTYNVVSVLLKAATTAAILMMFPWTGVSVQTYFMGMILVESTIVACLTAPYLRRGLLAFSAIDSRLLKASIAFGFPLILNELFTIVLDSGDRAVVQHCLGANSLGFYSVAYGLSNYVNSFMIAPLSLAIMPIYLATWNEAGPAKTVDFLSRSLDLFVLAAFGVMAVVWVSSHDALVFLASAKYQGADRLVPPIVAGLLFYSTHMFTNAGLILHKKTVRMSFAAATSAALNIGMNIVLVPQLGLYGAALATLWSYAFYALLVAYLAFQILPLKLHVLNSGRYALAALVAAVLAGRVDVQIHAANAVLKTCAALAVYIAVLFGLDSRIRIWFVQLRNWAQKRPTMQLADTLSSKPQTPHILYIFDQLNHLDGGAERSLLKLLRTLPRDQFRISVATFCAPPDRTFLEALDCPVHCFDVSKCISFHGLKVALQLRRIIRNEQVSIVQTFFASSDIWGGLIARLSGCRILISSRRDMGFQLQAKHRVAYRLLSPMFNRVHTVSDAVREFTIREDRIDPRKVVTIPNGVQIRADLSSAEKDFIRVAHGFGRFTKLIVDVGSISPVKGFDVLARTASVVCQTHPDTVFLIVGQIKDPVYAAELNELIVSLNLSENFRYLGFQADPLPLLQSCDIFCHLSSTDGMSNALLEAMSAKLPCVITAVGGNPELVRSGWNGYVVQPGDYNGAAQRICELLDEPGIATEMGRRGRDVIDKKFTDRHMAAAFTSMYDELLGIHNGKVAS